jgi:hypothetical protein
VKDAPILIVIGYLLCCISGVAFLMGNWLVGALLGLFGVVICVVTWRIMLENE